MEESERPPEESAADESTALDAGLEEVSETSDEGGEPTGESDVEDSASQPEPPASPQPATDSVDASLVQTITPAIAQIDASLRELRDEVRSLGERAATSSHRDAAPPAAPPPTQSVARKAWPVWTLMACALLILLAWSSLVYAKTSSLVVAFGVVVSASLTAAAMLFADRQRSS